MIHAIMAFKKKKNNCAGEIPPQTRKASCDTSTIPNYWWNFYKSFERLLPGHFLYCSEHIKSNVHVTVSPEVSLHTVYLETKLGRGGMREVYTIQNGI